MTMATSDPAPRVLVVDDDVDTCHNLRDILADLGYTVAIAHDGPAALELISRQPFDVTLLDLKMPGMDGLTLYREIKRVRSGTVAIIVTAYDTADTAAQALQAGAWRVLSKPVDPGRLMPLVEEASQQPLVMIIDDDHDLCASLWDILRERGYRVCVAHNEQEALERLPGMQHRVVLIDMKLPQGDGSRVFHLVRQANPQARVVLITGFRTELQNLVERVVTEGADAVCYKPFDMPQLLETVEQLSAGESRC
jgi:DNA-binding NtrC family response regulator